MKTVLHRPSPDGLFRMTVLAALMTAAISAEARAPISCFLCKDMYENINNG